MTGEDVVCRSFTAPSCVKPAHDGKHSHNDLLLHRCLSRFEARELITRDNALHYGMSFTVIRFGSGYKHSCRWRFKLQSSDSCDNNGDNLGTAQVRNKGELLSK